MILSWAPGIQKIVMPRESQEPHFRPKPLLTGKKQSRAGPEKQKMKCKWQMNRSETVRIQSHKIWSTALLETTTTLLLPWAEWTKPRRRSKTRARGTIVPICTKETYRIYTMLSSSSFSPNKENPWRVTGLLRTRMRSHNHSGVSKSTRRTGTSTK